jgi:hypothetical protein
VYLSAVVVESALASEKRLPVRHLGLELSTSSSSSSSDSHGDG